MAPLSRPVPAHAPAEHDDDAVRTKALVERARLGDAEAFGRLYNEYQAAVYRVIYAQTKSTPLTEDLTSETFFRALRGIQTFKLDADLFAAWLFRIARNLVIDHFKAGRTRLERADDMSRHEEISDGADAELLALLTRERMRAALANLSESQRHCLQLRFLCELTIAETAGRLQTSEGAVKQLQARGLRHLALLMRE